MKLSKMTANTLKVTSLFIALSFSGAALAEVAIVVNTGSSAGDLGAKMAKKIFLGKTKSIPGIDNLTVVGQVDGSAIKAEFTKKITKKGVDKYKAYWSKQIFSGKAVPPTEVANDAAVLKYVAGNINAIGYVDAASLDGSVKVVFRAP